MAERWMLCSACRKDIPYSTLYYACSVSTCNRNATRLVFCSVGCWDSHVATLRHRDAWAVDMRSPAGPGSSQVRPPNVSPSPPTPAAPPKPAVATPPPVAATGNRIVVSAPPAAAAPSAAAMSEADDGDILIVVSKLKKYIRDRSGMNASDAIAERLSDHIRSLCDAAIRNAAVEGRKTVLDRDIPGVRKI